MSYGGADVDKSVWSKGADFRQGHVESSTSDRSRSEGSKPKDSTLARKGQRRMEVEKEVLGPLTFSFRSPASPQMHPGKAASGLGCGDYRRKPVCEFTLVAEIGDHPTGQRE